MIAPLVRRAILLSPLALLTACNTVVMKPSGDIAAQQAQLIVVSTVLMLLIIVPVIILTIVFAWRYRASNTSATYAPDWDHSTRLELVIWGAPLLIIIALGLITWISTHVLDPYRPLSRIDAARPLAPNVKPLVVEVVAMDWKWLFIYPEQGIATVNELVAPVDVPVQFKLSASTVMNSFYVPALAGQIYAMPGMQTTLNAVINKHGVYEGFSANYSGAGFSDMRFKFHGKDAAGFEEWVRSVKAGGGALDRATYLQLEKPSIKDAVRHFSTAEIGLFDAIVERCVEPGTMCMSQMMGQLNVATPPGQLAQSGIDSFCVKPTVSVEANNAKQY
ncbi:ubiquinol oxidase subunit II [Massilia sp. CF038]|uniref:ubiquinol oxidase subunit II n=1 Tax=Massilia sp. CF038 TaxID=1881045 RepID=UPI0009226FDE|nr:ubiquinol oxidase subunit II [Massilia sp. CF038]SHG62288.1 cytochrome bo3 quinol oxidase subunit 2 [Massilia sp. CF038]